MKNRMVKRIALLTLAVILITAGGMAIYAGSGGFNNEPEYAILDCCYVEIVPLGNGMNGWNIPWEPPTEPPDPPDPGIQHPQSCNLFWCRQFCDWLGSCLC